MPLFSRGKAQREALKSTLRLLVMLREMLKAEGAVDTDLHKSVVAHANMVGMCLPNKDLVSKEELAKMRELITSGQKSPAAAPFESVTPPAPGQMVVLSPDQIRRK